MIELPSYDIDPKKLDDIHEESNIQELRDNLEKELEIKKKEKLKEEKKEKQRRELEEKRLELEKELAGKNITVDVNGEIIFIKPLSLINLQNDFRKSKANSKEKEIIENEYFLKMSNTDQKVIKVEKNPVNFSNYNKILEQEKNSKKKNSIYSKKEYYNTHTNFQNFNKQKNAINQLLEQQKKELEKKKLEKRNMKFAAGSNFELIKCECGVNIKEEKKSKSGGRDFFSKYGRCSLESFKTQFNKTTSFIYTQINDNIKLNESQKQPEKNKKVFSEEKNKIIQEPNEANNILSLKTKNLKLALKNLDLITDGELRKFNEKYSKNIKNKNIVKNIGKILKIEKKDFKEVNKFTKTLLKDQTWGLFDENTTKPLLNYKKPVKHEINSKEKQPRKRLPPISGAIRSFDDDKVEFQRVHSYRVMDAKKESNKKNKVEFNSDSKKKVFRELDNSKKGNYFLRTDIGFHKNNKK